MSITLLAFALRGGGVGHYPTLIQEKGVLRLCDAFA